LEIFGAIGTQGSLAAAREPWAVVRNPFGIVAKTVPVTGEQIGNFACLAVLKNVCA
jgi:hypothetical protein